MLSAPELLWDAAEDGKDLDLPERDWIIKDILPAGEVTLFNGHGATGKTIASLQLGVAVQLESDWMGHLVEQGQGGNVWFLTSEETRLEVRRRLRSIVYAREKDESFLRGFEFICFRDLGVDPALVVEVSRSKIKTTSAFDQLLQRAVRQRPRLIILENAAQLFDGDEVRRAMVTKFLGVMTELATKSGAAVLLLQHVSMAGLSTGEQTSGSTHWHNAVRSRMSMAIDKNDSTKRMRTLTFHKANYGKQIENVTLEWRNGIYVPTSRAIELTPDQTLPVDDAYLACLKIKTEYRDEVRPGQSRSSAAVRFRDLPEGKPFSVQQFVAAEDRLLRACKIKIIEYGPPSKRIRKIVPILEVPNPPIPKPLYRGVWVQEGGEGSNEDEELFK